MELYTDGALTEKTPNLERIGSALDLLESRRASSIELKRPEGVGLKAARDEGAGCSLEIVMPLGELGVRVPDDDFGFVRVAFAEFAAGPGIEPVAGPMPPAPLSGEDFRDDCPLCRAEAAENRAILH